MALYKSKGKRQNFDGELFTARGIILPTAWDERGNATAITLSTFNEEEFVIDTSDKNKHLFSHIGKEIWAEGQIGKQGQRKTIKIRKYSLKEVQVPSPQLSEMRYRPFRRKSRSRTKELS